MTTLDQPSSSGKKSAKQATQKMEPGNVPPSSKDKTSSTAESASANSEEKRTQMIREAAYCIAERRGFQCDQELDDWLEAEAEIDNWLSENN